MAELEHEPSRTVAVLRFSGRVTVGDRRARTRELEALMRAHGLEPDGEPTLAQYDPPWVLGVFRRNEIHIGVQVHNVALDPVAHATRPF